MWFSLAIFSALSPIDSPVENSLIAGGTGAKSRGRSPEKACTRSPRLRALVASIRASANRFDTVIGTLLALSAPPARPVSIAPAMIAGWLLAFTLSLDDLVIASFTTGPGATPLPMKIFSAVRLGVTPEINAVCTVLVGLVATGVLAASLVTRRQEMRREAEERQAAAHG